MLTTHVAGDTKTALSRQPPRQRVPEKRVGSFAFFGPVDRHAESSVGYVTNCWVVVLFHLHQPITMTAERNIDAILPLS